MINYNDIKSLKNQTLYPTSNEKYVLNKRSEKVIRSPEYKILGFLNDFCYSYSNYYITRSNLDGVIISRLYIGDNIDHGSFNENVNFMYLYKDKKVYKVTSNLEVEWELLLDDYIRSITMDDNGHAFIVYKNSRIIHEYLPDKIRLRSFRDSDSVTNKTSIYKTFVNKGRTEMYAIGSVFIKQDKPFVSSTKEVLLFNEKGNFIADDSGNPLIISVLNNQINTDYLAEYAESFIDKYDLVSGKRISHGILNKDYGVRSTDPYYKYDNIYVNGNNIYIYSNEYIQKVNKSMTNIWKHYFGYNPVTSRYNQLGHIEYDDNTYNEYMYFIEDLYETNGHGFGKLNTKGDLVWKIEFDKSIEDSKFSFGIYKDNIFTSHKSLLNIVDTYFLAVNNYNVLFKTKNGHLVRITRNNEDEIYSNEYYDKFTLLADVIKSDIPEYIDKPLYARGKEPLLDENGDQILISEYNKNYLNKDNFNIFKLKGEEILDHPYPNGAIVTKSQKLIIQTLKKKILSTLKPVKAPIINPDVTNFNGIGMGRIGIAGIIANADPVKDVSNFAGIGIGRIGYAEILENDENEDLGTYEYKFDICADRHIFRNNIITKKNALTILTKRTGASIMKKVKEYYKFIFRRFSDVDIVLEFIKESGVLNTSLPYFTDKLIHHTTHMIQDMQEAHIPVAYDLKAQKMFSYYYDNMEIPIRTKNTQVYLCHNLPYTRKKDSDSIFIDSMSNLVDNETLKPFIMFVDGKAIKWSNMTIVHNWEYDYIIISNIDHDISYKYIVDCILLPCMIRYGEDDNILPIECEKFLFDKNGKYTNTSTKDGIRVEIIDPNIYGITYKYDINTKYIKIESNYNQIASDKNILIFEDNKFSPDNINYITNHGKNLFTYDKKSFAYIKTFYYIKANDSKNILNKIPHQTQVEKDIETKLIDSHSNEYINNFRNDFDYSYNKKYSYNENVSRAIEYIMSYDMSLLNKYYIDQSNVRCYCYSGKDILDRSKNNYLEMPRDRKYGLDDYVVIFKNGKLYDRYREIKYKSNMFKIPVNGSITENDDIEIVHYKNVDNRYYPTRLTHMSQQEQKLLENMPVIDYARLDFANIYENNWYYRKMDNEDNPAYDYKEYLVKHLRHGNLTIWGNNKSGSEIYDDVIPSDNYIQYPIEFEYKNNKDEYGTYQDTEIIVKDRYYKYKMLNFTSKRQFHNMYYNIMEEGQNIFDLDQSFKFCQNKKQYMIFVNGKKLNYNDWDLLIPRMDQYTIYTIRPLTDSNGNVLLINDKPLKILNSSSETNYIESNRMSIKTNSPLHLGDIIDIIYVPDPYDEIILHKYIPNENGIVELDKDILQYPFSKDLFLVFMNGKKVPNDQIDDINMNKIRLKVVSDDDKSNMDNITICKYINPDNILKELYSYGDEWSDAIDKLSDSDFYKLFVELKKLI